MRKNWIAYLLISPLIVLYAAFRIYPILTAVLLSFFKTDMFTYKFVGLKHYVSILLGAEFLGALWHTAYLTSLSIFLTLLICILLGVLLIRISPWVRTLFTVIYFLPMVMTWVVAGLIWKWLYDPTFGFINMAFQKIGIAGYNWLGDPWLALNALVVVNVWKHIGLFLVITLANLQMIDPNLYEVASIDGADRWHQFVFITVPLLRPAIWLTITLGVIFTMGTFSMILVMTGGGPRASTDTLVHYIFWQSFHAGEFRMGYGSAGCLIIFAIILSATLILNKIKSRGD